MYGGNPDPSRILERYAQVFAEEIAGRCITADSITRATESRLQDYGESRQPNADELVEAYLERMKEVSMQSLDHRESGLGLVRIAYEGHAILDFMVDQTRTLNVSAVRRR